MPAIDVHTHMLDKNLKIIAVHGGATLPDLAGRLEIRFENMNAARG